jgi:hypothetical protein
MPVKIPSEWRDQTWTQATVKHHPQQPGEQLLVLSDIIVVKHPWDTVLSYGDLILAVGLCDVFYNASRDPQRRRKKAVRALRAKSGEVQIDLSSDNGSGAASNNGHQTHDSIWAGTPGEQ